MLCFYNMEYEYFKNDWCNLNWTDWLPLNSSAKMFRSVPTQSGVYRVRSDKHNQLFYIGQTGISLRGKSRYKGMIYGFNT